jgi:hypothetical protein
MLSFLTTGFKRVFLFSVLTFLLMVFPGSIAIATDSTPALTGQQLTFPAADTKFATSRPVLKVGVKSTAKIVDVGVVMAIDGQPVNAQFTYQGHWQDDPWSEESWYVVDSYNEGVLTYSPLIDLGDGNHLLTVTFTDTLNNIYTQAWNFSVAQPPIISSLQPANATIVATSPVSIRAVLTDPNGPAIDQNSIVMLVDNIKVIPDVKVDAGGKTTITYNSTTLNNDQEHIVTLSAADTFGNTVTSAWKFRSMFVGTSTGFSGQYPVNEIVNSITPTLLVHFSDPGNKYALNRSGIKIDGLAPQVKLNSSSSYYSDRPPSIIGVAPEYSLSYVTEPLADGIHTVTVTIPALDTTVSPITSVWNFSVNVPPVIKKVLPLNTVTTNTPTFVMYATDNNSRRADGTGSYTDPLAFRDGILTIDNNEPVVLQLDKIRYKPSSPGEPNINGRMSYKPLLPLNDGEHKAAFSVFDSNGNSATREWSFIVDTKLGFAYPSMPAQDDATCLSCHSKAAPVNGGIHPEIANCYRCHSNLVWKSRLFNNCTYCHFDNRPTGATEFFSYRHTSDGYPAFANIKLAGHPLEDVHLSATKGCEKCHSRILTSEHNRPERIDQKGNRISCANCHTTSDQKIKAAISNKDTNCNTCHPNADHQIIHVGGLDAKCQTCHNKIISLEHINNPTTQGKGYTCDTCHGSQLNSVKRTIASGNLKCSGCHQQAHGLNLADSTPGDIPLYQGFTWTRPIEAVLFQNELGIPAGYDQGQVVISSRKADVSAAQLGSFYQSKLTAQGWELQSGSYLEGSSYLTAQFTNNTRALTLIAYNTATNSGTGAVLPAGFRVELWYK